MTRLRKTLIGVALAILLGLVAHVNHYKLLAEPAIDREGHWQVLMWDRWRQRVCVRYQTRIYADAVAQLFKPADPETYRVFSDTKTRSKVVVKTMCL